MRFGVVVFPGSNCDHDAYHVLRHEMRADVSFLWHKDTDVSAYDCIILPGGFSYGDYLRCGAIAKFSPVMREVVGFANRGGPVIGICNGFQILLECGLLPGAMLRNRNLQFICRNVYLRLENGGTPFTGMLKVGDRIKIPIAHMEGNYFADRETLRKLNDRGQVIFRYCDRDGNLDDEWNYNGAIESIAGICNEKRNVLGMMPHPERCSEAELENMDGKLIFQSAMNYLQHT